MEQKKTPPPGATASGARADNRHIQYTAGAPDPVLVQRITDRLAASGGKRRGAEWRFTCPAHEDTHPSADWNPAKGTWCCRSCDASGGSLDLAGRLGINLPERRTATPKAAPRIIATYDYTAEDGALLYQVVRYAPKAFKQRRPDPDRPGEWLWNLTGTRRVPYRLPELLAADPDEWVYVVEGEKDADAARLLGLVATTNAGGAGKWPAEFAQYFTGLRVCILPDNDTAGEGHTATVGANLAAVATDLRVLHLPNLAPKGDLSDWLAAGGTEPDLGALTDAAPTWTPTAPLEGDVIPPGAKDDAGSAGSARSDRKPSQAARLVELADAAGVDLFHDGPTPYATVAIGGAAHTIDVESSAFAEWLRQEHYKEERSPVSGGAVDDAVATLAARAKYEGPTRTVHLRRAAHGDARYIDLGDATWQVAEVDADGWRIIDAAKCPVRFRRSPNTLALPQPVRGGDVSLLRPFLNVPDDDDDTAVPAGDWVLMLASITAALLPTGPYPVTALGGEQGSAKTTTARVIKRFTDPAKPAVRSAPRNEQDVSIAAQHNALLVLDNISTIQPWLSDALCRLSTGGGLGTRTLFKNQEETVFDGMLPVVLTAIEDVANRSDLLDRALVFTLPTIPPDRRCTEAVFWADLDANAGLIMGGLLDLLAGVLRELPDATLTEFPRMADFALLGVALERAAGWPEGAFMDAYTANRGQVNASAIDAAVIGRALVTFLDVKCEGKGFTGMVAGLLHALNEHEGYTPTGARPPAGWPATPRAFGGHLRRLAPNLRANGFDVLLGTRTAKGQPVTIAPQPEPKPDPQRAQRTQRASQARKPAESDVCSPGPMYIDLHQHTQPGADSQAQNALSARCVCPEPNPAADDDSEVF